MQLLSKNLLPLPSVRDVSVTPHLSIAGRQPMEPRKSMDTNIVSSRQRWARTRMSALVTLALVFTASSVFAETLLMPERDYRRGVSEVVWGVSTLANGTSFTLDYGDGTTSTGADCGADTVTDRSFIACNHAYANTGLYTVTLTVGAEVATVQVQVFDPPAGSEALRDLNINRSIQDALRYLWVSQIGRASFDTTVTANWGGVAGYTGPAASLVALAFQNHGYRLPNNNSVPTGLYEKYVVRKALNYVLDQLRTINLDMEPAGNPCVGTGAGPDPDGAGPALCVGLQLNQDVSVAPNFNHGGYETPLAVLPFAGSGAMNRTVTEVTGVNNGGFVVGKTYGEILQRLINAIAWGQLEIASGNGTGGWSYGLNFSFGASDGSTVGWAMLALLDGAAAGMTIPAFVQTEWSKPGNALSDHFNDSGSFDYGSDNGNRASNASVNMAKTGVGLQGAFFGGRPLGDTDVQLALDFASDGWNEANPVNGAFQSFICQNGRYNKGCGYGMFNLFKGLKLYGVQTLPGVGRPAGPGAILANDWHADYEDFLVANQTNPTGLLATSGAWATGGAGTMAFSSQTQHDPSEAALALLILAPVALVLPDEGNFSTVGLAPATAVNRPGTSHTVTATARASNGSPIAGTTIDFTVLAGGANAGKTGQDTTDVNGEATFTYTDTSVGPYPKTDRIQASVGNLNSNIVEKIWVLKCDADSDNDVDNADLVLIRNANGQAATGPHDPRDGNSDKTINVLDVRYCQQRFVAAP
jgi:hypothetical protein